ncbi:hypothetical protein B296_00024759 [Ensete ventricosum]|uniref:DUF1677 domain-containing protein n=1 Tax=Ensete ventricosum TaxID=4639 RepID=A0A426ZUL8_ENSVE|nr:hypothetical protein B296_00024759 [Ensete ventricosum]
MSALLPPLINSSIPFTPIPQPTVHLRSNRGHPPVRQASSRVLAASPSLLLVVAAAAPTEGLDSRILLHRASLRPAKQLRHRSHIQSYLGKFWDPIGSSKTKPHGAREKVLLLSWSPFGMAPNGEMLMAFCPMNTFDGPQRPRRPSLEGIQRAVSDITFQLSKEPAEATLPPISEVEDASCECCGMSEECTPEYIRRVREKFSGKWICGLCSEAVKEETAKNGGKQQEALEAHMSMCERFSRIGRTHPVLYQADAMREILRKSSRARAQSSSPRDRESAKKSSITRSSSCIPAITKEMNKCTALKRG